jgi:hypothetical protein
MSLACDALWPLLHCERVDEMDARTNSLEPFCLLRLILIVALSGGSSCLCVCMYRLLSTRYLASSAACPPPSASSSQAAGMGCCHSSSKAQNTNEERIKRENEREASKAQLEEALKNMANGGHQMLSSYTAPYSFTPVSGRNYFKFGWPASGSVQVTSFGVRVVAQGQNVEFVEGLANYATNRLSWKVFDQSKSSSSGGQPASPTSSSSNLYQITLDQYHSVDANTGEQTPVNTCQYRKKRQPENTTSGECDTPAAVAARSRR